MNQKMLRSWINLLNRSHGMISGRNGISSRKSTSALTVHGLFLLNYMSFHYHNKWITEVVNFTDDEEECKDSALMRRSSEDSKTQIIKRIILDYSTSDDDDVDAGGSAIVCSTSHFAPLHLVTS